MNPQSIVYEEMGEVVGGTSDLGMAMCLLMAAYAGLWWLGREHNCFRWLKTGQVKSMIVLGPSFLVGFTCNGHLVTALGTATIYFIGFCLVHIFINVANQDEREAALKEERSQGYCDGYLLAVQNARMIEERSREDEAEALRLRVLFNSNPFEMIACGNELISQRISGECKN